MSTLKKVILEKFCFTACKILKKPAESKMKTTVNPPSMLHGVVPLQKDVGKDYVLHSACKWNR